MSDGLFRNRTVYSSRPVKRPEHDKSLVAAVKGRETASGGGTSAAVARARPGAEWIKTRVNRLIGVLPMPPLRRLSSTFSRGI